MYSTISYTWNLLYTDPHPYIVAVLPVTCTAWYCTCTVYGCGSVRDWAFDSDLLNSMNFGGYSQVLGRYSAGLFADFGE